MRTEQLVQVKAAVPRELKRKAFAALALREEKFNRWLERELAALIHASPELAGPQRGVTDRDEASLAMTK
jgi:hypothetical protein